MRRVNGVRGWGVMLGCAGALVGCKTDQGVQNQENVDTFQQAPNNQVDILWVVDDSFSMEEEQAALAEGFAAFANELESSGTEFQIGVITTTFEYADPERGKLVGDPPFLTNADDYVAGFTARATVGTGGSDKEKGLEAAYHAVSPINTIPGGINENFVRPDAQLLVVIVSDEQDCSDEGALEGQDAATCYSQPEDLVPVNDFVVRFRELKDDDSLVSVGVIVGIEGELCPDVFSGSRYVAFARAMGGLRGNICSADWSNMLGTLGLNATGIRTEFQLSKAALVDTLVVRVDETEVPSDPANGWTYDEDTWYLTFHGTAVPPRGSTVTADYTVDPGRREPVTGTP